MGLRVCLVSPFAWSRPHDVNEHVGGLAAGLRELGHEVTVLAPSTRAADLVAGRRALLDGANAELKIEVWDSPNSAGVVIDAVRLAKLALNNGIAGTLEGPSSYLMKSPPVQYNDDVARDLVEDFIGQNARGAGKQTEPAAAEA